MSEQEGGGGTEEQGIGYSVTATIVCSYYWILREIIAAFWFIFTTPMDIFNIFLVCDEKMNIEEAIFVKKVLSF